MAETGGGKIMRPLPGIAWRLLVFAVAFVIIYVFATSWSRWDGAPGAQKTDDAYLQADLTPIGAKVPGYVRAVYIRDYDRVHAGQLIALLVDDDYRAALAQAEAGVGLAQAQIGTLEAQRKLQDANIAAARAVVAATSATLEQSQRDVARAQALLASGSGSQETVERVRTTRTQLLAQLDQNRAQLDGAQRQAAVIDSQIVQARASLAAQGANREVARINLAYTRIVAPADGVISLRQILPGQYLPVGGQVTVLTGLPHVWVIANYRETQLTHVRVGQSATVAIDTFPDHRLRGHVQAISPASGAQFSLLPPDNATGNFTKIVQRFAVKIAIDDADGLGDLLRPGMSVVPTIDATAAEPRP
jgi:membrane fusion protein (multidrug efflux system)